MRRTQRLLAGLLLAVVPSAWAWAGPVNSYHAHSIVGNASPPVYGLRLDGFYDGDSKTINTFSFDDVMFEEFEDGTARLHGQVELNTIGAARCCNYWLDVHFKRGTDKKDICKIINYREDWRYYMIDPEGLELWSMDDPSDTTHFWSWPKFGFKPFQVGYGANGKNDHFGASGWVSYEHHFQDSVYGNRCIYLGASDFLMDLDISTDVESDGSPRPTRFTVKGNFPNPFNPSTTMDYYLTRPSQVTVEIFDIRGARVQTLLNGYQASGHHMLRWDGTDSQGLKVGSGTYLYRIAADGETQTRKMILLK